MENNVEKKGKNIELEEDTVFETVVEEEYLDDVDGDGDLDTVRVANVQRSTTKGGMSARSTGGNTRKAPVASNVTSITESFEANMEKAYREYEENKSKQQHKDAPVFGLGQER